MFPCHLLVSVLKKMNLEIEIKKRSGDIHRGIDGFVDDDKENQRDADLENVVSSYIEAEKKNDDHGNNTQRDTIQKGDKTFQCQDCGKLLSSKQSLKSHVDAIHKQIKDFQCQECNKKFRHKGDLNALPTKLSNHFNVMNVVNTFLGRLICLHKKNGAQRTQSVPV